MKIPLIVAGVGAVALAALFVVWAMRTSGDGPVIRVSEVPRAIAGLGRADREHSFLVFMFDPPGRPGAEAINLQLSIDKGRVGLDWVLLGASNQAGRPRVEALLRQRGCSWREAEVNHVRFLRVEDGDIPALASAILTELYGLTPDTTLQTVVEGFELER